MIRRNLRRIGSDAASGVRQVEVTGPAPAEALIQALDKAGYPATVA